MEDSREIAQTMSCALLCKHALCSLEPNIDFFVCSYRAYIVLLTIGLNCDFVSYTACCTGTTPFDFRKFPCLQLFRVWWRAVLRRAFKLFGGLKRPSLLLHTRGCRSLVAETYRRKVA